MIEWRLPIRTNDLKLRSKIQRLPILMHPLAGL